LRAALCYDSGAEEALLTDPTKRFGTRTRVPMPTMLATRNSIDQKRPIRIADLVKL